MQLEIDKESLPVYEALASDVRLRIIQLLSKNKMNLKQIADTLELSSPIVSKHVEKLEQAGIIRTEKIPGKSGLQRVSFLKVEHMEINFPKKIQDSYAIHETSVPIGHYTDYDVLPTCGLASSKEFIGILDQPKYFMAPQRVDAGILWFTQGFVEYKLPNYLNPDEQLHQIDISFEIGSEFPLANSEWPSEISFSLNGHEMGSWISPGDFADKRGKMTPDWWPSKLNQYGLLKTLQITSAGTYIDGDQISDLTINDLDVSIDGWTLRIEVREDAKHVGGVTLFGKKFGNHEQDIIFKLYYI
ncbi:putative transcriptional regulator [Natronobacillus azotifigens]|uniref:Helix-turn-helix domain-containing protein n=1 Tax=Natronobacillus azotifigens TaxID=472978 RepID=A0A9J6R964_9BACI|nr:helix-turn-helix domain-containing protein [Natronobacillus azotifigens]MCZ0702157.1 helix-turn-helix domain-containing protein [Natronobacillus azotifigens]